MKVPVISSLLLMFGIASPLLAIERPKALDGQAPEAVPADRAAVVEEETELKEEQPAAWLGVFGETADKALAAQLGLNGGVVLRFVAKGSPAADAGLKVHDVIESVDGDVLNSQDDLRAAVLAHKPGEELKMDVVSGGAKKEVGVTLGDRPANLPQVAAGLDFDGGVEGIPNLRQEMWKLDGLLPGGKFEKEMEGQLKKLLEGLPNAFNGMRLNLNSTGSVQLHDEHGSVELNSTEGGGTEVEVRNKAGELLYEGPWDNDQDKAAVAPEVRKRIERLNFNGGASGLHFRFNGAEIFPQDQGDAPEPPADELNEVPDAPEADAPEADAEGEVK